MTAANHIREDWGKTVHHLRQEDHARARPVAQGAGEVPRQQGRQKGRANDSIGSASGFRAWKGTDYPVVADKSFFIHMIVGRKY